MPSGNYASINGLTMYYEVHGGGQPLVLIHGGGSTIDTSFGKLLPLLAKLYKVIAVEMQAHGHTGDRPAPESFEQDADDIAALLQYLQIPQASIFGFSNGGNTAMQVAIRHPELVSKLVLASAFYKRAGMIPGFFEGMQGVTLENMPQLLKDAFVKINPDPAALQNMFNKDRDRMLTFTDWSDDTLQSVKAPSLIIMGDKDVVLPEHGVQMAALIPEARLMILPANHGSYIGEICSVTEGSNMPELTVAVVNEFLEA
jgi:pimeloyl-ACP methyl ester carboxylesterase